MSTAPGSAGLKPPALPPDGDITAAPDGTAARRRRWSPLAGTAGAIALALFVGAGLLLAAGVDPLAAYRALLDGAIGSSGAIQLLLLDFTPLLIIALGLAAAFRARVWNIGADGQFQMGALVAAVVLLRVPIGSPLLAIPVAMAVGAVAGAVVGLGIAVLRARWHINEVVTSLLSNYIVFFLLAYVVRGPLRDAGGAATLQSKRLPDAGILPLIPGSRVHVGLLVGLALVPVLAWTLARTPFGFKTRAVGLNAEAAEAAGIATRKVITRTMLISGGLAGLAGAIQLMGSEFRLTASISTGIGFTAIVVALLGRLGPFGIVFSALLIAGLSVGGDAMEFRNGVPNAVVLAIEALIVLFVLLANRRQIMRGDTA
jgi:ABC-type uncharacterized transport system permease subunit